MFGKIDHVPGSNSIPGIGGNQFVGQKAAAFENKPYSPE